MKPTQGFLCAFGVWVLCLTIPLSSAWAQVRPPGTMVRVNDIDMHYQIFGSGEPLLLLHGFGGCGDDWRPFSQTLAKQFQVIVPDLRGHGWSTNPAKIFSHRQSAADVLALIDHLALERVRPWGSVLVE